MSFSVFKQNMKMYMQNQEGITSSDDWAKKVTQEYDMCIKRGLQTVNNIPISAGNTSLMETLVRIALKLSLSKQSGLHTFADDIGKGVVGYWTGATLLTGIPPIIPATGAIQNISTTAAFTTVPGTWSPVGFYNPNDSWDLFLDVLISSMMIHLTTIQGLYMTMSLYPGVPPFVAPGVLTWTGFNVP